ncbi:MAG: DEAD/DEAH box helicase [Thermodesulfobacteriota bacterium]
MGGFYGMVNTGTINEYIQSLISSDRLGVQVAYHQILPEVPTVYSDLHMPLPNECIDILQALGIQRLYRHQAASIDQVRCGQHLVVATPTASGKTLVYNLPLFEMVLTDADARALYIFPLKALAQDQLRAFETMAANCKTIRPSARIYDGDTSAWHRKRIRATPPNVVMTNPDMLHLALLAHHSQWAAFLTKLKLVVVDEVHTYRGVMGSHMAQVFRRFLRVCRHYGSSPAFIFSSATIGNPEQLTTQLTGLPIRTVTESGAPQGKRHVVFIDPYEGPAQTAILLLKAALHRGLRTIVYTQSRKLTELIAIWAQNRAGAFADRISAYRAGFLPEERRVIEAKLSSGELLAVISTSALELGIDIGDLDLCILVGYPGTVIATWQRGGRVGRSGQESALVMIAGEDALDQYFIRNPRDFFERQPEAAVVNPYNPEILMKHLACAAAELPLGEDEPLMMEKAVKKAVLQLEADGGLLRSADGKAFYSSRKAPHRTIDLRGAGPQFRIENSDTGEGTGEIDGFRAFKETHPGAVYLHRGETYLVDQLDLSTATVKVSRVQVNYYTRVRGFKDTEIIEIYDQKSAAGTRFFTGRLKVTDQVTGYEKWAIHTKKRLNIIPLDLPPLIFETDGLWFVVPHGVQQLAESRQMHFMGGIHAVEHAAIGIFPLLVMADRNDLGGISTPYHPQTGQAAVFIYDGIPGGAGLSRQAYEQAEDLLAYTHKAIASCPCESGCPSCVHSPKCGSGNRPIDKAAAVFLLERIRTGSSSPQPAADGRLPVAAAPLPAPGEITVTTGRYGVLDIETQQSFQEVGGWHRADLMQVSCAVLYDSGDDCFYEFLEHEVPRLIEHLQRLDVVIGFNIRRFDYRVLSRYTSLDFQKIPTLDILEEVHQHLGYRLSLDHLARMTLDVQKSADGLVALQWWKEGKIREIAEYCKNDVAITRDLFRYGKQHGYLLFKNKAGHTVRIPVKW